MFSLPSVRRAKPQGDDLATAVDRSQALIEMAPDGRILRANKNARDLLGYAADDLMRTDTLRSLSCGEGAVREGKVAHKDGQEIWIRANCIPILNAEGKPAKIVALISDITRETERAAEDASRITAIGTMMGVAEYALDGTILDANENFVRALGYIRDELKGQHHRTLVGADDTQSAEYARLWEKLARGESASGVFKRLGRGGKDVWLRANYHPVHDASGRVVRIVKFSTDITQGFVATRSLQTAAIAVLDAAETNDLSERVPVDGQTGDLASVCAGINRMLDAICGVIGRISGVARELVAASAEISASTGELSRRTESQAATLEQTAAAMTQMAGTVKTNAEHAQEANRSAAGALDIAGRGGRVVAEAVQAMTRIDESSRRIGDIIGVIDEIARQTNLLALNAAVEAARAGDAGRGFAVVAAEVRTLAQRSAQAAKDIKGLIVNSNDEVRQGVDLVNRAGGALNEIVQSKAVATVVSAIAQASKQQASGIEQVNKALGQMDRVTQQNSALVEENAASAQNLERQAAALGAEVAGFKLSGQFHERPAIAPRATVVAKPARATANPPVKRGAPIVQRGTARTMQTALATAVNADDWKDF